MGRAAILDEQSHVAEVLIELFETGLPAMVWYVTDVPGCVMGSPLPGLSDHETYIVMVQCAERLGMQLTVEPSRPYWQSQGSDEEHSAPAILVKPYHEDYLIKGVYHGVQLSCSGSASEGTAKKTNVPKSQARSSDPDVTAQLQALTVMISLLSADLPPLSWRLRPENHEPQLTPEIHTLKRRRQARAGLIQWADFLGTQIRYDPRSMYAVAYNSAEVTGRVDGVPITITAHLRRPLSDTRPWQALRRQLTGTNKPTAAQ